MKKALAVILIGAFLSSLCLADQNNKLAPELRLNSEDFKYSFTVGAICKHIEHDGNLDDKSYLRDVLARLDTEKNPDAVAVLPNKMSDKKDITRQKIETIRTTFLHSNVPYKILERIIEELETKLSTDEFIVFHTDPVHGFNHAIDVTKKAFEWAEYYNFEVDREALAIGAFTHDIKGLGSTGIKTRLGHHEEGAGFIGKILEDWHDKDWPATRIDRVKHIIRSHRGTPVNYRVKDYPKGYINESQENLPKPDSIEALLVRDADTYDQLIDQEKLVETTRTYRRNHRKEPGITEKYFDTKMYSDTGSEDDEINNRVKVVLSHTERRRAKQTDIMEFMLGKLLENCDPECYFIPEIKELIRQNASIFFRDFLEITRREMGKEGGNVNRALKIVEEVVRRSGSVGKSGSKWKLTNNFHVEALNNAMFYSEVEKKNPSVKVLLNEIIIEIPNEGLAVRYFDPTKANVITPYADIAKLSTKVISPRLNRQIIHRVKWLSQQNVSKDAQLATENPIFANILDKIKKLEKYDPRTAGIIKQRIELMTPLNEDADALRYLQEDLEWFLSHARPHEQLKDNPKVSVVILHYGNSADQTLRALENLSHTTYDNFDIILVDNNSPDKFSKHFNSNFKNLLRRLPLSSAEKLKDRIKLVTNRVNLGYTGGNNQAARIALKQSSDYVFFLNNDARLESDGLKKMVNAIKGRPEIGALQPSIFVFNANEKVPIDGDLLPEQRQRAEEYTSKFIKTLLEGSGESLVKAAPNLYYKEPTMMGTAQLVRADMFRLIGGFDTRLFMFSDENDIGYRYWLSGLKKAMISDVFLSHPKFESSDNFRSQFLIWRNHMFIAQQYYNRDSKGKEIVVSKSPYNFFNPFKDDVLKELNKQIKKSDLDFIAIYKGISDGILCNLSPTFENSRFDETALIQNYAEKFKKMKSALGIFRVVFNETDPYRVRLMIYSLHQNRNIIKPSVPLDEKLKEAVIRILLEHVDQWKKWVEEGRRHPDNIKEIRKSLIEQITMAISPQARPSADGAFKNDASRKIQLDLLVKYIKDNKAISVSGLREHIAKVFPEIDYSQGPVPYKLEHVLMVIQCLNRLINKDFDYFYATLCDRTKGKKFELADKESRIEYAGGIKKLYGFYSMLADGQKDALIMAVILHDIGYTEENVSDADHPIRGAKLALQALKDEVASENIIDEVGRIITHHDTLGNIIRGKKVPRLLKGFPDEFLKILCIVNAMDMAGYGTGTDEGTRNNLVPSVLRDVLEFADREKIEQLDEEERYYEYRLRKLARKGYGAELFDDEFGRLKQEIEKILPEETRKSFYHNWNSRIEVRETSLFFGITKGNAGGYSYVPVAKLFKFIALAAENYFKQSSEADMFIVDTDVESIPKEQREDLFKSLVEKLERTEDIHGLPITIKGNHLIVRLLPPAAPLGNITNSSKEGRTVTAKDQSTYIDKNKIFIKDLLSDDKQNILVRVPIEAVESINTDNIKNFLTIFQKAPNGHVEFYYMSGTGEVSESIYQRYGLEKKPLPKDFKRTRENTITLFPALKGEELDQAAIRSRLGNLNVKTEDTILSPIGLQNDPAGLIRATILGLKMMDIAQEIKEKGIDITRDQAFKDKIQLEILEELKNVCDANDLKNFNLTSDDIIALATGDINKIIASLKKLIKLLPITPIDAEELRQIYEHAKAVITAA
ncbi:MAG: HD domain-containing protein [Candidatus Omnitrophica bacterium]|nr:HD domain-containing protein [Candidatus Omnitrophota bacterium]